MQVEPGYEVIDGGDTHPATGTIRQLPAPAAGLIGATLDLIAQAGAAQWCAYLVPGAGGSWRVALASGATAPAVGATWSPAHLKKVAAGGRLLSETPYGVLCAEPIAGHTAHFRQHLARTVQRMFERLGTLAGHTSAGTAAAGPPGLRGREDTATGLLAREAILARLDDEVARAQRYGGSLSVYVCEVEAPDHVSGDVGRSLGDVALAAAAVAIRTQLRQMDCAGRYGSRSFLLILPETAAAESLRAALRLTQAVTAAVAAANPGSGLAVGAARHHAGDPAGAPATTSLPTEAVFRMGGSTFPLPGRTAAELLAQAEQALAEVRQSGGDASLAHAVERLDEPLAEGFRCVCRRCGKVFSVLDRAQQRARRFCSHECYTLARRAGGEERDDRIRALRRDGCSLRDIGRRFGLSAERVRQILESPASDE